MSETSQNEAGTGMPDATVSASQDDAEPVSPAIEVPASESATPPDAALEELKTEVLSAVRGAITGVMNRHQPAMPGPDLDFDFSFREAEQSATELPPGIQQALVDAVAAADAAGDNEMSPATLRSIDDVDLAAEPGLPAESEPVLEDFDASPELELSQALVAEPLQMSLTTSSSTGVPVVQVPLAPPPRRNWPAWTTAALLSMTGIAVGAGTATLIIEPDALGSLRDRVDSQLRGILEATSPSPVDESEPSEKYAAPNATAMAASGTGPETKSPSVALEPDPIVVVSTPPPEVSPTASDAAELKAPQTESLAAAVKVATAHNAAAFAHRIAKPLGAGAAVLAGGRSTQLEALAALPPQSTITAAPTGGEITPVPTELTEEPARKTDSSLAANEPASVPAQPADETAPIAAPLSALARAHAALSKGDVEEARLVLQAESEAGQVEGMLLLARSYDPSYLAALGLDPANGKREIAEKLYRAWYDRSVELGLVSASVNIDRLLKAMARAKP